MPTAYASTVIDAPITSIWQELRNFGALASYETNVQGVTLEGALDGDQVGSVRIIRVNGGQSVRERLLALSDVEYTAAYTVEMQNAPFKNAVSQFKLRPVTDQNVTFIEWSTTFDAVDVSAAPDLLNFMMGIFADCFHGIRRLMVAKTLPPDGGR